MVEFWPLAAIDGQSKNFSVSLMPVGFCLSLRYDVMSAEPYHQLSPRTVKLAIANGDSCQYHLHENLLRHFRQTGR